jgi:hypothetical protein
MKRTKVTDWPMVTANVNPTTLERIEADSEDRGLSVPSLVRLALDSVYRPKAL